MNAPLWTFDRADRLAACAARCADLADRYHRERCDATDAIQKGAWLARRSIVLARRRRLLDCARIIRRDHRQAMVSIPY